MTKEKIAPHSQKELRRTQKLYIYMVGEPKVTKEKALRERPGRQHGSWVEVLALVLDRLAFVGSHFSPLLAGQTGVS